MRKLFVIHTPYQLMSAVSTITTYKMKSVDCILAHQNLIDYKKVLSKFVNGNVFIGEKLFDNTTNKGWLGDRVAIFRQMLAEKEYVKKCKDIQPVYDELYVPSDQIGCRVIYHYLKSFRSVELKLFDDGTATYLGGIRTQKKRLITKIIHSIFLDSKFYEEIHEIYCYRPELLVNIPATCKAFKISTPNVVKFFDVQKEEKINTYCGKKVIFFDQGINLTEQMKECMKVLERNFFRDEIIVKKHPRINGNYDYKGMLVSKDGLPSEFIVAGLKCKNMLFVSYASTSCLTPYLLFGEKPFVIMFLKMGMITEKEQQFIDWVEGINGLIGYEYVFMPENAEQFNQYIDTISDKIKLAVERNYFRGINEN